jgi:hypothetical protein
VSAISEYQTEAIQLDLFSPYDETAHIKLELYKLRKAQDVLRRALFARHGDIAKHCIELYDEIEQLKIEIDKIKRGK